MKKFFSISIICVLICVLFGCSNNSKNIAAGSSGKQVEIFVSISHEDTFISTLMSVMKDAAQKNNMKIDIKDAKQSVESQVEDIKYAKSKNYDSIVCLLTDADTAQQITRIAGDTPVIFINIQPDDKILKKDKYIYVASNENEVVDNTVKYLSNTFKQEKNLNVVLFEGDRSSNSTIIRTDSLKFKLKQNGFNVNYVFEDEAGWDRNTAKEMFKTFLQLKKNYDCIISNNDEMALGVIEAMEEEGIDPSDVPIFGVDANPEACQAILAGKMAFTLKQSGHGQGESVIRAIKALTGGGHIKDVENADQNGKYIWYPYSAVDKSNAKDFITN